MFQKNGWTTATTGLVYNIVQPDYSTADNSSTFATA